jgi:pimeloyl-ACP methyl ester carboxylesterase
VILHIKARILASVFTLLVVTNPSQSHATPAAPIAAVAQAKAATTQMAHISIVTMGSGSPVILIPGLSSPRAVYDGVANELAKGHQVHVVQVNGFDGGDPGANLAPGILDGIVADLDGYIAKNKLQEAAVVGHSMGGLVALMLAKAHPVDVSKLMIVDSLPYIGDIFVPGAAVAQIEPQAKAMRDQQVASYGKPASEAVATATANRLALKPGSRALAAAWFKTADPRVSGQAMYEDMTTDLRPDMAKIATPITLVYPYSDALPKERADAFYRAAYAKAPDVSFVAVGDSAHFVMLDQPETFMKEVQAFLAD